MGRQAVRLRAWVNLSARTTLHPVRICCPATALLEEMDNWIDQAAACNRPETPAVREEFLARRGRVA